MYSKSITTNYRTAFAFAIDLSGSMNEKILFRQKMVRKSEAVADVVNTILSELIERARREDGVRDYYDVAVVGYSGDNVCSLLNGNHKEPFITVCELDKIARERICSIIRDQHSDYISLSTVRRREWVQPKAMGQTPMHHALWSLNEVLRRWCSEAKNRDHCAPTLFNITDGNATDCHWRSLEQISEQIKSLGTSKGNVLMVNVHLTSEYDAPAIIFPTDDELVECRNKFVQALSTSSSYMPEIFTPAICAMRGISGPTRFRAMSYNASIVDMLTILNIGSISVKRG